MYATTMTEPRPSSSTTKKLLRRVGVAGFTFFLVKGILWLVVPAAIWAIRG